MSALIPIAYSHGDIALSGHIARPEGTPRAAILMFPTIANFNAPVERRAQMLADRGYLAFVADLYGVNEGDFFALAGELRADTDYYRARLMAALTTLRDLPEAAGLSMATIGYCLGGQAALEIARVSPEVTAVVSFHGLLSTGRPAGPGAVKARVLVCHGDADPMVPREDVIAFWNEMDAAGAQWHFHSYGGVKHGFTDPGSDARGLPAIAYDASADRQSWAAMLSLFDEVFTR